MKIYDIYDGEAGRSVGVLLYYEKEKSYIVELEKDLDEWSAPLLFTGFVKRGVYTMPRDISHIWVKERIIPSGRQNIGSILKEHKLKEYDEMKFLEISAGRCSQDSLWIVKKTELPEFVSDRQKRNLAEVVPLDDNFLLCVFTNGEVKKVDMNELPGVKGVEKIRANDALFKSVKVSTGGYAATFNDSIDIPVRDLYEKGMDIPLNANELRIFVERNIIDTGESCDLLECSRQNLSYMIEQDMLKPVKKDVKGNIFFKGDVIKNQW